MESSRSPSQLSVGGKQRTQGGGGKAGEEERREEIVVRQERKKNKGRVEEELKIQKNQNRWEAGN